MRTLLLSLGLLAMAGVPSLAAQTPWYGSPRDRWDAHPDSRYLGARLWVEDERDYFRRGDRLRIRFSTSDDAYVALVHIDTDGNLDFLYPLDPWSDSFVRGGLVHSLPRGYQSGWTVRGRPGIGYVFLIASPVPLDYGYFAGRRGGSWDWSYAGRAVHGDPFWAMEQITRVLVPGWPYTPYAVDHYSYYVDGRFRYPHYACADRYRGLDRGWGWYPSFGDCDRLHLFLREQPYYYDARLYRGDRRAFFRDRYGDDAPLHGFKEDPERTPATGWDRSPSRGAVPRAVTPQRREPLPRDARPQGDEPRREAAPARRPSLERRGSGVTGRPAAPPRAGARGDRSGSTGRVAPRPRRPAPSDTLRIER
jgi:hypothetical protein